MALNKQRALKSGEFLASTHLASTHRAEPIFRATALSIVYGSRATWHSFRPMAQKMGLRRHGHSLIRQTLRVYTMSRVMRRLLIYGILGFILLGLLSCTTLNGATMRVTIDAVAQPDTWTKTSYHLRVTIAADDITHDQRQWLINDAHQVLARRGLVQAANEQQATLSIVLHVVSPTPHWPPSYGEDTVTSQMAYSVGEAVERDVYNGATYIQWQASTRPMQGNEAATLLWEVTVSLVEPVDDSICLLLTLVKISEPYIGINTHKTLHTVRSPVAHSSTCMYTREA